MIRKFQAGILLLLSLVLLACQGAPTGGGDNQVPAEEEKYERIVSLSGAITELLFAMGKGDQIVGVDVTSTFPSESVQRLPRLGHVRNLNTEAVLGLKPDLIIAEKSVEHSDPLSKLAGSGIEVLFLEREYKLDNPMEMVRQLAHHFGPTDYTETLQARIISDKETLKNQSGQFETPPSVLFIYARGTGNMMVAGEDTPAAAMIALAGGRNAIDEFEGFKALSTEGLLAANPDVILLFESGLQSIGGFSGLKEVPGMKEVTAGQREQFIAMDGLYLLGFTARASQAAVDLSQQLLAFQKRSSSL